MRHIRLALIIAAITARCLAGPALAAEPAPCEDVLRDVKATEASARLSDVDKTRVAELRSQGIERCKADDDQGADELFAEAMKIMGK